MLPGDRLVCAFVEPQSVGSQFETWPLHVTVVPWFRLADPSDVIAAGLLKALRTIVPFTAMAAGEAMFGPRKTRLACLLRPTEFVAIEVKVRVYLHKKRAWIVDETTKRPRSFRPHVTNQRDTSLHSGDTFRCDQLYIVEQKGDYKEVVSKILLSNLRRVS